MKKIFQKVLIFSILSALIACGTPPVVEPFIETPIKTAFGTPVGSAVTQTFDATGGTFNEPTTRVTVKAFAGGFDSSAQVSVQPITNTLPSGLGMGVKLSSSEPLKKPLIVRFGYGADAPDPSSLGLAVQAGDGSWLSLPIKIDTVNKTVSAALLSNLATIQASSLVRANPAGSWRVVEYKKFYFKPESATVKVGKTVSFVPWATVNEKFCPSPPDTGTDDDLVQLVPCQPPVDHEKPFTNIKAGFVRTWFVNGSEGGDSTLGTIQPSASIGATYTAPTTVPIPNTVAVHFFSAKIGQNQNVPLSANVTIVGNNYTVVGDFTSVGYPACPGFYGIGDLTDHVEFKLAETGSNTKFPYLVENIQNQASDNKNFRSSEFAIAAGASVTQNAISEVLNATKGHGEFVGAPNTLRVTLDGDSWTGGCTLTAPGYTLVMPTGETIASFAEFSFDQNSFVNNKQTVQGEDSSGFGSWEFTITKL
jgi:hypothetical protein